MKFQVSKIVPQRRVCTPVRKTKNVSLLKQNSLKNSFSGVSPAKQRNQLKLRDKQTIQTIMFSKSTYVQKLCLSTTSWCLYDSKKSRYLGFRERYQRQIASITKVMTVLIAIQFFQAKSIPKDLLVKVTEQSSKLIGTTAQLKEKTWVKLWDLLYGAMLPSGNDAANLLSEVVGYYKKNPTELNKFNNSQNHLDLTKENTNMFTVQFIKMMNKKAEQLELTYTKFSNPHGLQNAMNISTPKDIISMCLYATENKDFKEIMNCDTYRYEVIQQISATEKSSNEEKIYYGKKSKKRWWNTNILLKKGWQGVKTGHTSAAGCCLASLKNGIYIVVLNCKNNDARFVETEKIYDWYIENYVKTSTEDSDVQSL